MTRKISAFGTLLGTDVDPAADYLPINDASVADALKNKRILINELRKSIGPDDLHPPSTSLFSYTANGTGVTQSQTYNALRGLSVKRTDAGTASADRVGFIGKAVPGSTPWTATAKIEIAPTLSTEFHRIGMAIHESATGKVIYVGHNTQGSANGVKLTCYYYSSLTAFGSAPGSFDKLYTLQNPPQWFRISYDGTTYTFSISFDDGVTFTSVATALSASFFTADKIGVAMASFGAITTVPMALVRYWDDPDFAY
jgi:hypothetical protein